MVIFQPEIRRGLEQLGSNPISKFFGFDKDIKYTYYDLLNYIDKNNISYNL